MPTIRPSSSSKFGGQQPHEFLNSNYLFETKRQLKEIQQSNTQKEKIALGKIVQDQKVSCIYLCTYSGGSASNYVCIFEREIQHITCQQIVKGTSGRVDTQGTNAK